MLAPVDWPLVDGVSRHGAPFPQGTGRAPARKDDSLWLCPSADDGNAHRRVIAFFPSKPALSGRCGRRAGLFFLPQMQARHAEGKFRLRSEDVFPTFCTRSTSNRCHDTSKSPSKRCARNDGRTVFYAATSGQRGNALPHCLHAAARNEEDRRDALQETALKAWRARGQLRNEQYFTTWLVRILMNECRSLSRKGARCVPIGSAA